MRVISGKAKGRKLFPPIGDNVRPTTDRIKETVFNILGSKKSFDDTRVLDLFAGSGALGIEAISRGAAECVFVDKDVSLVKANLEHTQLSGEVYQADYRLALKKLSGRQFDFIFLDPPYAAKIEQEILESIIKYDILAKNGIIFIEHSRSNELPIDENSFIIDERNAGKTAITFLRRKND